MPKNCPRMCFSPCECRSHSVCVQFVMTDHQIVVQPIKRVLLRSAFNQRQHYKVKRTPSFLKPHCLLTRSLIKTEVFAS